MVILFNRLLTYQYGSMEVKVLSILINTLIY